MTKRENIRIEEIDSSPQKKKLLIADNNISHDSDIEFVEDSLMIDCGDKSERKINIDNHNNHSLSNVSSPSMTTNSGRFTPEEDKAIENVRIKFIFLTF